MRHIGTGLGLEPIIRVATKTFFQSLLGGTVLVDIVPDNQEDFDALKQGFEDRFTALVKDWIIEQGGSIE